jgi:cation:H+ antiporter
MTHLDHVAFLLFGGLLLYLGAEWLVRGAAGLATRARIPPLVVGLTVVAYGTSAPELVVGVGAALSGRPGIAFGNAIGSNVANIGLILGLTAVVSPPAVDASLLRREIPVMIGSALLVPLLLLDGQIGRGEGIGLVLGALAYTLIAVRGARRTPDVAAARAVEEDAARAAPGPEAPGVGRLAVLVAVGLVLLLLGGRWLVDGASGLARIVGVSERVVGLTVVAVGTSVPELATSLIAARRGHSAIAVGNVVGSNIFNVLLILGAAGAAGPLEVPLRGAWLDIGGLVAMTLLAAVFLRGDRRVSRVEGSVLVALYIAFVIVAATAQPS